MWDNTTIYFYSSFMGLIGVRIHKERAQPAKRRKYGLLEKHKDYKIRANDYHKKQQILRNLQRKAELKNEDEFYFSMEHQKMAVCYFFSSIFYCYSILLKEWKSS